MCVERGPCESRQYLCTILPFSCRQTSPKQTYRRQDQGLSLDQINLFDLIGKESRTNFRSLGIEHNGHVAHFVLGRLSDPIQDGPMAIVIAVTKVQTGDCVLGAE